MPLHQTGSVLVVDDDEANRDIVSRRLRSLGHAVRVAADGFEALAEIEKDAPDLILLDWMMPGKTGLEVLEEVRRSRSALDLPIIMATAKGQTQDIVQALELGANDYITKPIHWDVLQARLNTHLSLKAMAKLKDDFLSMASHDLRNPLSSVNMVVGVLHRILVPGREVNEEARKWLDMVRRQVTNMRRIVETFLEFGRLDDGAVELTLISTDLNDIVSKTVEDNAQYARSKEIGIEFKPGQGLQPVHGDPTLLTQVVQNLLGNAIKFSQPGSSVIVSTRRDGETDVCEVTDSGPGIPTEEMNKLFHKHARLTNKPTGSEKSHGIGLFICKRMVDLHHGQIGARNNSNEGSTFWFQIPCERVPVTSPLASA